MPQHEDAGERALQAGAWALPAFGVLLTLGSLTHQPDPTSRFAEWAAYVTAGPFLVSHLVASIGGAVLGVVGLACVAVLLARGSDRPVRLLVAAAAGIAANVLNTALYGVAAFAQPAVGRAALRGTEEAERLYADVYGPPLLGTAVVALLLWTASAVVLGTSIRRRDSALRAVGVTWAVALPLFYVSGLAGLVVQPLSGVALTVAAVVLVRRLPALPASADRGRREPREQLVDLVQQP